jgi:alkane 1-monooxygenase
MHFFKKISFLVSFTLPLSIPIFYYLGAGWLLFFPVFYAYVLIPLLDLILGRDTQNVLKEDIENLVNDVYFDILVYAHVWIQILLLIWEGYLLSTQNLSLLSIIGLIFSQGVYASTIINVAHELGHRQNKTAQFHAKLALASVFYTHFTVEHNRGHHVHVATPADPATSKRNQNLYAFWIQSLVGSLKSAFNLEAKRLEKQKKAAWSWSNEVIRGHVYTLILFTVLIVGFSFGTSQIVWIYGGFLLVQSLIGILSLEAVNYIEHYGIQRKEVSQGRYERVNPLHSWNSNHSYSNLILFQLQRHSDHHAYANKPYQVLRNIEESPQLPHGYSLMIMIALVPKLWYAYVHPILDAWQAKRDEIALQQA